MKLRILFAVLVAAVCAADQSVLAQFEIPAGVDPFGGRAVPVPAQPAATSPSQPPKKDTAEDVEPEPEPVKPLPPGTIRVHLHDGSLITGILSNNTIDVETQFGTLTVPVDKIMSITPGLDSQTDRLENLKKLIESLGAMSYSERDKAEKKLLSMGLVIRSELKRYENDKNAERKNRVQKILAALNEMAEDEDPAELESTEQWRRLDTINTEPFMLAGRIKQKQFELASRYGKLNIRLADIKRVERPQAGRQTIRRTVAVAGSNIVPRQYKNSHIMVRAGDRVRIRADGTLNMTPWGSSAMSTPDGAPNYGWYISNKIPSGALVMRIGGSGQPEKVGSKHTFIAKKSGTLQFGIGMNSSYVNHNFPGTYNVKVSVEPGKK